MPTVIPASNWHFDPDKIDTGFQPNHGHELTTDALLRSMEEINARPETDELFRLIKESDQYACGRNHA